jgi:uncharacterized protein
MNRRSLFIASLSASLLFATAATAEDKLKALIIDGQNNHNWQETSPILAEILKRSGRFDVEFATSPPKGEDLSGFLPDFASFDVIVSNYNGDPWPESTRKAFEDYMANGGGFVCFHAANNAFADWDAYNQMIAVGGWGGRKPQSGPYLHVVDGETVRVQLDGKSGAHGKRHEFPVVTHLPDHPIMRGFPEAWMQAEDELYDSLRGPAVDVEVLAYAFSCPETGGSGANEPMLLVTTFGEGRTFHTALGHDAAAMASLGFQLTLARGAEWAATGEVSDATDALVPHLSPDTPTLADPPLTSP